MCIRCIESSQYVLPTGRCAAGATRYCMIDRCYACIHVDNQKAPLSAWQVLDNGRRLHLDNAASAAKQYLSGFFKNVRSAVTSPFAAHQQNLTSEHHPSVLSSSTALHQIKPEVKQVKPGSKQVKQVKPESMDSKHSKPPNSRQSRSSGWASASSGTVERQTSNGAQHSTLSRNSDARPDGLSHSASTISGTAQDQTAADAQHSMLSRTASEQEAEANVVDRSRPGEDGVRAAQAQLAETDHSERKVTGNDAMSLTSSLRWLLLKCRRSL